MIKLDSVNKYFNHHKKNEIHVINNTSLTLEKGLVAFLGNSGSGKTTLLNIIGGLDKFNKGSIYINDKKITKYNYYKMDKIRNLSIGYIFQDYKLIDNLTVYDNIALVLKMIGIKNKKEIQKRVTYVLEATGIYRYRNRLASMLSGGERQRVGIARALVQNPDIILADEPTGNLDSKNSIEVMNIIKAISKKRLVILVTHEVNLAKFYADRVLEIVDGKVVKDYTNEEASELDYRIDNKIYLKDFEYHNSLKKDDYNINIYSNEKNKETINIIFKNGNIYISGTDKKVEVVDNNSNIEVIDDHYKKINKNMVDEYDFDLDKVSTNEKKKYSSIYNPITLLINGFKKVFGYSLIKKLLLIGFFMTGMFLVYSISSIAATIKVNDEDFITKNRNYLNVSVTKISIDDFKKFSNNEDILYMIPGDSIINLRMYHKEYYQSSNHYTDIEGSLTSIKLISENDIIYGTMPTNSHEIVIDRMVAKNFIRNYIPRFVGLTTIESLVGKNVYTSINEEFKIVGITDLVSPSIYVDDSNFISIIGNKNDDMYSYNYSETLIDYKLSNDYTLVKGRLPKSDYEVMVNIDKEYSMKLDKEIDYKIGDRKLMVVGYYSSKENIDYYFVNENMIKYKLAIDATNFSIVPKDEDKVIEYFKEKNLNISNSYDLDREMFINGRHESVVEALIVSGVIIAISLVEIFLMIRSSFLSRVKEIGILRAIGVKKTDIVKLFLGEILAIATTAGLTGIILMAYILSNIAKMDFFTNSFIINSSVVIISIILMYTFNIIIGLLPVLNVLRKTPASILSRHDIE